MIINPKKIIEDKIITFDPDYPMIPEQIQQVGIDLRIDKASYILGKAVLTDDKDERIMPEYREMELGDNDYYHFIAGRAYAIDMMEYVRVPANMMALITHRSTLNRSGIILLGSIYDAGFKGTIGATMRCMNDVAIKKGTRVAQIVFYEAAAASTYKGKYQGQKSHKEQEKNEKV